MNRSKLAALASILGVVVVGGVSTVVWQPDETTTVADLADAGVGTCPVRLVTCNWRVDADGASVLEDAGISVGRGYRTLGARVRVCTNGIRDVVFPPLPQRAGALAALAVPDLDSCTVDPDPGGALWRAAPSACVAAPLDGGRLCRRTERDGGFRWFGAGNRMLRGESNGHATCEDVPCVVFAGDAP